MLDVFRKRGLSTVVYGVIIVATVFIFVIEFRPNAGQRSASLRQTCVATVRGWCIGPKDHTSVYRVLIPRGPDGSYSLARARQLNLLRASLDGLVERELLVGEAERLGLAVSEEEINDAIYGGTIHLSLPSDNPALAAQLGLRDGRIRANFRDPKTKQFDIKTYERNIRTYFGRSPTDFREEQGRELLAAKVRDVVRAPVRVSEAEALESYLRDKSNAAVSYIELKPGFFARHVVTSTPDQIAAWANQKANADAIEAVWKARKEGFAPKAGHVRHILAKVPPSASPEQKGFALGKLAAALRRIRAGEPFAVVAHDVSDDVGSAEQGGDVGDKTDGFVGPFKKAADEIKPGELTSAAVETVFGYHLIAKDDPAMAAELEPLQRRALVRELWGKAKALELAKSLSGQMIGDVRAGKKPEEALKGRLATLPKAPAGPLPALGVARAPSGADTGAAAGSTDAGSSAGAPEAPPVPRAHTAEDDPERPQVQVSSGFNRNNAEPIPDATGNVAAKVIDFAFAAKDGDVMPEPLRSGEGFLVVQLKEHKSATKEEFDKDRDTQLQMLLAAKQAEALSFYVRRLRESAKKEIKIDESYLRDTSVRDGGVGSMASDEEDEP